jgi:3-oxoadipate enol-lactonase
VDDAGTRDRGTGLAATQGWLAAVAALRADLLGRYLLDVGGDPARRAWALAQMRRTPLVSALAAVSAVYQFSSHTWAGDIDVPTAVIIPSRDRVVPPTRQHKLAAAIPDAVTYELDGDHGVFLTAPDRFLTALRATCQLVDAPPHAAADNPARSASTS